MTALVLPASTNVDPIEFSVTTRFVRVPVNFTITDVLRPGAWAHIASKIQTGNEIVALRADMAWRIHLLVFESGPGMLKVHVLGMWVNPAYAEAVKDAPAETPVEDMEVPDGYSVNHAPKTGWRVWLKDPAVEVSRNHATKNAAILAARAHYQSANAVAA